jgi:nucleotide-binding universal stress UspA family protein
LTRAGAREGQVSMTMRLVVIGYDGSPEAGRAIAVAAEAVRVEHALVVNVWHDVGAMPDPIVSGSDASARLRELEQAASAVAAEGAARARAQGLDATPASCRGAGHGDIGRVLLDVADEHGADLVVVGCTGSSLLKQALLGSVSGAAVRDARCPVLVVPVSAA